MSNRHRAHYIKYWLEKARLATTPPSVTNALSGLSILRAYPRVQRETGDLGPCASCRRRGYRDQFYQQPTRTSPGAPEFTITVCKHCRSMGEDYVLRTARGWVTEGDFDRLVAA